MTKRKKYWLAGIATAISLLIIGAIIAASILARRFEPMLQEQAVRYLRQRFHSDVRLAALRIHRPKMSMLDILLRHGRGALVSVEGEGLSMRMSGASGFPPLFVIRKLWFTVDLGTLADQQKKVEFVDVDGIEINIPPKGARPLIQFSDADSQPMDVLVKEVQIRHGMLVLLPSDSSKEPLRFDIADLRMASVGKNTAMKYQAALTIPKPPGTLQSQGSFGPWAAAEPGDTPLDGHYTFEHADLGVFNAIAGTLSSTGTFQGTLDAVQARGQATVPNFRLKAVGNPIPLSTRFEALVDGTNGDTVLRPVRAKLGSTSFTTTGAVIKHEKQGRRAIRLTVAMHQGEMHDLLQLAVKGSPSIEGLVDLKADIDIPPLTGAVREKLLLDGTFKLMDAKFLRSSIQSQIDQLSRRGQGQPKNEEIDQVASNIQGSFRLENQIMTFRSLSFEIPGAAVNIAGTCDLGRDVVDFHGTLGLDAKLSQTMTGWKRWALKPADPFFAKHGSGTFLHIKIDGNSHQPRFGLDRGHREGEAAPPAGGSY